MDILKHTCTCTQGQRNENILVLVVYKVGGSNAPGTFLKSEGPGLRFPAFSLGFYPEKFVVIEI